jgi:hypothetical protein
MYRCSDVLQRHIAVSSIHESDLRAKVGIIESEETLSLMEFRLIFGADRKLSQLLAEFWKFGT